MLFTLLVVMETALLFLKIVVHASWTWWWLLIDPLLLALICWPPAVMHTMMRDGEPYMTRVVLTGGDGRRQAPWPLNKLSNRFIHWLRASDGPEYHSHPYTLSRSRVLFGLFVEERLICSNTAFGSYGPDTSTAHKPMISEMYIRRGFPLCRRYEIDGEVWHRLDLVQGPVITYFTTSKKHGRGWGFTDGRGKFRPAPR